MVVNSIAFLIFFVVVFIVYYMPAMKNSVKVQNAWLLLASYFFYGYADIRMVPLLFAATLIFYLLGIWLKKLMDKEDWKNASYLTTLGTCLGVGLLLYFKYLNFFAESFSELLSAIGFKVSWTTLNIVLPIGVSFFTFKLISYIVEIHRERIEPSKDFVEFATYIAFFPTILSGPIDRPKNFIPQLWGARIFNYDLAIDGFRQILWGMFTKMCIADNLSSFTDSVWNDIPSSSGSTLLVAALIYPIQMYADFDGYSNMAIGVGKILGIKVARNFNHPFLARNIAEYWRNWHISLTGWLTDYVFSPLNIKYRKLKKNGVIIAVVINFVIIGFWHGANWTFGVFGLYHGLLYIPLIISGAFGKSVKLKPNEYGLPFFKDFCKMIYTFLLVTFGLIMFRATDLSEALLYCEGLMSYSLLSLPSIAIGKITILLMILLLVLEWYQRDKEHPLQMKATITDNRRWLPYVLDYAIIVVIIMVGNFEGNQFIYFQF